MRQLLKTNNRQSSSLFSTTSTTLRTLLKTKAQNIKQYQQNKGLIFEKHLKNTILATETQTQQTNTTILPKYKSILLTSARPIQSLLKQFIKSCKEYNQHQLTAFVRYLSKAYQISRIDSLGHLDVFGYRLFQSQLWMHFIEEIRYALSEVSYVSNENVIVILEELVNIGYLDWQVVELVAKKIEARLNVGRQFKNQFHIEVNPDRKWKQMPQIQKQGYYSKNIIGIKEKILESKIFQSGLTHFKKKHAEILEKKRILSEVSRTDFDDNQSYQNVIQLLGTLDKFIDSAGSLVEAVMAIRKQYAKMVVISENDTVLRNPQLNHQLLQIQEQLLLLNLISIKDIKNPQKILESQNQQQINKENKNIEQILRNFLEKNNIISYEYFSKYLYHHGQGSAAEKQVNQSEAHQRQEANFTKLLSALARYANIDHVLYGTSDRVSLINTKWQRYFLQTPKNIDDQLEVDRIFRKSFSKVHSFLGKHEPLIEFQLFQANIVSKIHWFNTLLSLGFHKDLLTQFTAVNFTKQMISQKLGSQQLLIFVKLLNNLYPIFEAASSPASINHQQVVAYMQPEFKMDENIHKAVLIRLREQIQEVIHGGYLKTQNCVDIINYIYQYGKGNKFEHQYSDLYERCLQKLQEEIQAFSQPYAHTRTIKQALQILEIEKSKKYSLSKEQDETSQNIQNPFLKTLRQICDRISANNKPSKALISTNFPFTITGFNYKTGRPTALLIVDGDYSSIDSLAIADGNTNAYCMRIQQKFNIQVHAIGINKFLDITYYTEDNYYQPSIKIKNANQIIKILNSYYTSDNTNLLMHKLIKNIKQAVQLFIRDDKQKLSEHKCNKRVVKLRKIVNTLDKLLNICHEEKNSVLPDQLKAKRLELVICFDLLLKRDFNLLKDQERKMLAKFYDQVVQKFDNEGQQKNNINGLEKSIVEVQENLLQVFKGFTEPVNNNAPQIDQSIKRFIGKRLSIDCLSTENNDKQFKHPNPQLQLIHSSYYLDHRYVEYEDWMKLINKVSYYSEMPLNSDSSASYQQNTATINLLASRYLPNNKQLLVAIPTKDNQILTTSYPLNWKDLYYFKANKTKKSDMDKIAEFAQQILQKKQPSKAQKQQLTYITHIQNLKHELKVSKTQKQICQYLLSFEFIDTLLDDHLENASESAQKKNKDVNFIKRQPKEFFQFLKQKDSKFYLQSPYLSYIFQKIEKVQELKDLLSSRKSMKAKLYGKFMTGQINKPQYFQAVKKNDLFIIEEMKKQLNKKMLAHNHQKYRGMLLADSSKLVQLQQNVAQLQRILEGHHDYYDFQLDEDYILSQGSLQSTLNKKREQAEINFILFRIIYKSLTGRQKQITEKQTKFLNNWVNGIYQNIKSHQYPTKKNSYSNLPLKKISTADKSHLTLPHTNFMKHCGDLALNDLVLQLSHFFDDSKIFELERQVIGKYYKKKLDTNNSTITSLLETMFNKGLKNKVFSHYCHQIQEAILSKQSQFNEREIGKLTEMTKMFKTQGYSGNKKYEQFYKNFQHNIRHINTAIFPINLRNNVISQYLETKDNQFYKRYNPQLKEINKIKSESSLKVWVDLFKNQPEHTTSPQIKNAVDQICKRIIFIKNSQPPYFSYLVLGILRHSKTSILCKQKLLAYLRKFNIPLEIDSEDIIQIIKQINAKQIDFQKHTKQLQNKLKEASKLNEINFAQKIIDSGVWIKLLD